MRNSMFFTVPVSTLNPEQCRLKVAHDANKALTLEQLRLEHPGPESRTRTSVPHNDQWGSAYMVP